MGFEVAILRLTLGRGMPSLRPAADRLPASTAATSRDMASSRSIRLSFSATVTSD